MAEIDAKKSKLDKEWTTEKVGTLFHHYIFEQPLWDITHSKDVRQKALAKIQEKKPMLRGAH